MKRGITVRKKEDIYFIKERYLKYFRDFEIVFLHPYNIYYACDAYAIIGGGDADPELYNEKNLLSRDINKTIDALDMKVLNLAVQNKKPILGICRGLQMINIYFNGSLNQDVFGHSECEHKIFLVNEFKQLKDIEFCNSYHHQTIKKIGNGLQSIYCSYDGETECIIHKTLPIIAVQFHPEMNPESDLSKRILMYFKELIIK